MRIVGAHWPTKVPSWRRPVSTNVADSAIAPTARPMNASEGILEVCCSTVSVARSS